MNKRRKIIVSVTGIFIVLLILVGLTYAYFLTRINGNTNEKSVSVSTKNLELTYQDGNGIVEPTNSLEPGDTIATKTFSVRNDGDKTKYIVVVEDIEIKDKSTNEDTTFERIDDFRYTLTCIDSNNNECNGQTNEIYPMNNSAILVANDIDDGITQNYELTLTYKEAGEDQSVDMNKTFTSKINIRDPQGYNPYAYNKNLLAYHIINNASIKKNGTEFVTTPKTTPAIDISYASSKYDISELDDYVVNTIEVNTKLQGYYWTYGTEYEIDEDTGLFTITNPKTCMYNASGCIHDLVESGETVYLTDSIAEYNSNSENILNDTTDLANIYKVTEAPIDGENTVTISTKRLFPILKESEKELIPETEGSGLTYYYRGDIRDNYINFSGKCFRIVRIENDGAIKLILEDINTTCNSSSYTGNWRIESPSYGYGYTIGNVVNSSGETSSARYNIANYFGEEIDYMTNIVDKYSGGLKSQLDAWINNENNGVDKTKLKTDTWCLGNWKDAYDENGNKLNTLVKDLQYDGKTYYYNTGKRLYGLGETANATFDCSDTNDKTYTSLVGTLTADEVVYAGGKVDKDNKNYYLKLYNVSSGFRTLSPAKFSGTDDCSFGVRFDGRVMGLSVTVRGTNARMAGQARPAVSLVSGIEIISGEGTRNNPYEIK